MVKALARNPFLRNLLLSALLPFIAETVNRIIEGKESERLAKQLGVSDEAVDMLLRAIGQMLIERLEAIVRGER